MSMLSVRNEYDSLRAVAVCSPSNFRITSPINETQAAFYNTSPPDRAKLMAEHDSLARALTTHGVRLFRIAPKSGCPFQMFTRDVGFVIGNLLILSNMGEPQRSPEVESLRISAIENGWKTHELSQGSIEGGDVVISEPYLYVGVGRRSSLEACNELRVLFSPRYRVVPIRLAPGILHLDTVLSILPRENLITYLPGILDKLPPSLSAKNIIEISEVESQTLAANMLPLSESLIIVQGRHVRIQKILEGLGFGMIVLDIDEITKLGGGPRCSVLPLRREINNKRIAQSPEDDYETTN